MYAVHYHRNKDNLTIFKSLIESYPDLLLWKNNKGSNVLMMIAKRGLLDWAVLCHKRLKEVDYAKWLSLVNNRSDAASERLYFDV